MEIAKKWRRRFVWSTALVVVAVYLAWPVPKDDSRMAADPALLQGKQNYLSQEPPAAKADTPNVVIILADDLGKHDISLHGGPVPTPHIEALARSGVTFSQGYVVSPVCSPSRSGLLTGRYPQRFGNELQIGDLYPSTRVELLLAKAILYPTHLKPLPREVYPTMASLRAQGLRQSELTFADLARWRGLATGIIGKWHQGNAPGLTPLERGFDYHFGFYSAATTYVPEETEFIASHMHWEVTDLFLRLMGRRGPSRLYRNGEAVNDAEYLTSKIARECEDFIERNKEKPFLLYVPFNAPHEPFQVPKEYCERFADEKDENKQIYYAMISAMDDAVGRIMAKLREAGVDEKTLVFFGSDNGGAVYTGATTNAPLKGGKLSHLEGGINVPFVASWPGVLPAGAAYAHPVSTLDIFTTVAKAIGAPLPGDRPYDGADLVAKVNANEPAHEALYWRSGASKAVRKGPWKLILNERESRVWLYNLESDLGETHNLAEKEPAVVEELRAALSEWERHMPAPLWPPVAVSEWRFGDELYTFDI